MSFYTTIHCTSKAHCRKCRDKNGGRKWREQVAKMCGGPNDADFACPNGYAWGSDHGKAPAKPKVKYHADGRVTVNGKDCPSCAEKRKRRLEALKQSREKNGSTQ